MIARMAEAEAMAAEQRRKYQATLKAGEGGVGLGVAERDVIAAVRGEVLDIALDHAVIEAAGVGYKVMATPATLATLRRGAEARLITAMIVREDSMTLYGFADSDARNLFLTLHRGVRGRAEDRAGRAGDVRRPDAAAGDRRRRRHRADPDSQVGKKTRRAAGADVAGQDGGGASTGFASAGGHSVRGPVVEALVGLGFAVKQAEEATDKVLADEPGANQSSALRAALSMLGRK